MAKITVTIEVPEKALEKAIKAARWKIKDRKAYEEFIRSPKFAKRLAKDMRRGWDAYNDADPSAIFDILFVDCDPVVCDW